MNEHLISSSKFDADLCNFIILVKYNPVLYDPTHFLYGERKATMRAWTKIAKKLGNKDVEWCVSTWESLKTYYSKRMRLRKEERKEWPYDKAMNFLDPYIGISSSYPEDTHSSGDEARAGSRRRQFANPRTFSVEELKEVTSEMIAACCSLI